MQATCVGCVKRRSLECAATLHALMQTCPVHCAAAKVSVLATGLGSNCNKRPAAHHREVSTQGGMWRRKGWAAMDQMREKLEGLKELRDLVRSLGRGGGWGPLRRAPVQVRSVVVSAGR